MELCWPGATKKHSHFVLYMPSPAFPSLVLLIPPQALTQGPFPLENRSRCSKLWGKSQEVILGDGTDYMIMA